MHSGWPRIGISVALGRIYTDPKISQFSTQIDRNPIRRKGIRGALTMIKLDARLCVDTRYLRFFILDSAPPTDSTVRVIAIRC